MIEKEVIKSKNCRVGERVGDRVSIKLRGRTWWANYQHHGRQRRQSLRTTSKKEARRKAIALEAKLLDGRLAAPERIPPLEKVAMEYLQHLEVERKAKKTRQKCDLVVRRVLDLAARRGVKTIDKVTMRFVDAYRGERVAADAQPKTVLNETVIIRQLVNFALSRELISVDPLRNLKLKKVKSAMQPCFTRPQVAQILTAADDYHRPMLTVLADTGIRVGELKHLTWNDVDFDRGVLRIRAKLDWQPKTGDERSVPMSATLRQLLAALPRRGDWVFTAATSTRHPQPGRQISERRLLQYLKRLLKRLGLPGHLHTFRHAFISNAVTHGIPEAVVRAWVGHVDAEIMKLYTHIADAASQDAMRRLTKANEKVNQPEAGEGPESKSGT